MAWAKVDDELHTNEKFASISLAATGLWTLCLSWTCHQLKDGFVPAGIVRRFAGGDCTAVTELVEAGLWEEVPGGYQFHDYLQYNPPAEKVIAEREAARERMGRRRGEPRSNSPDNSHDVQPNDLECSGDVRPKFARTSPPPEPDPDPVPRPGAISTPQTDRQTLVGDLHPARVCEEPAPPIPAPPRSPAPLSVGRSVGRSRLSAGGEPPDKSAGAESLPASAREIRGQTGDVDDARSTVCRNSFDPTPEERQLDPETAAEAWCQEQLAGSPELATRVREAREKAQKAGTTIRRPWQWQRGVIEQVQREQAERRARAAESVSAARDHAAEVRIIRAPKLPPSPPPEHDPLALPGPMDGLSPMERLAWLKHQEDQIAAKKAVPALKVVGGGA